MKKWLTLLFSAGVLFSIFYLPMPWDPEPGEKTYYIKEDKTLVYSCPDIECEVVGYLDSGDDYTSGTYDSIEEMPEWVPTVNDGQELFFQSSFLTDIKPISDSQPSI